MILLGVNIDHIATVRQARGGSEPSVIEAALVAEQHGADGITVHLREDRRHIQDADVRELRARIATRLNLEMALVDEIVEIALEVRPDQVTLVPERRQELTTEGGLDAVVHVQKIQNVVKRLQNAGIDVSLFIGSDKSQIDATVESGARIIEIHTGEYANANTAVNLEREFKRIYEAAVYAHTRGLLVNAGHGLNYENTKLITKVPHLHELNIGHSIIARSLFAGLGQAVFDMKAILQPVEDADE